jgi:hypothetical protein
MSIARTIKNPVPPGCPSDAKNRENPSNFKAPMFLMNELRRPRCHAPLCKKTHGIGTSTCRAFHLLCRPAPSCRANLSADLSVGPILSAGPANRKERRTNSQRSWFGSHSARLRHRMLAGVVWRCLVLSSVVACYFVKKAHAIGISSISCFSSPASFCTIMSCKCPVAPRCP